MGWVVCRERRMEHWGYGWMVIMRSYIYSPAVGIEWTGHAVYPHKLGPRGIVLRDCIHGEAVASSSWQKKKRWQLCDGVMIARRPTKAFRMPRDQPWLHSKN